MSEAMFMRQCDSPGNQEELGLSTRRKVPCNNDCDSRKAHLKRKAAVLCFQLIPLHACLYLRGWLTRGCLKFVLLFQRDETGELFPLVVAGGGGGGKSFKSDTDTDPIKADGGLIKGGSGLSAVTPDQGPGRLH